MKSIRLFALLLLSCLASPAFADYWVCRCDGGLGQSGCTAGTGAGTSAADASGTLPTESAVNALSAGSTVYFCQGGAFTFAGWQILNPNATQASPITFTSYAAGWGGGGVRPRLIATGQPFVLGPFGDTTDDGGYVFRGLHLDGTSCANNISSGIYSNSKAVHDLTIDDMLIEHFKIGVQLEQTSTLRNTRVAITNSTIRRSWGTAGIFGDADNLLIEGNTLTQNGGDANPATCGAGNGFEHAIYLSGDGKNGSVRNNAISGSGTGGSGGTQCSSGGITFHGTWDGILVEGNTVDGGTSPTADCGGVDINAGYDTYEAFLHVRVAANTIINSRITASNAPGVVVENNRVFKETLSSGIYGIEVPRDLGNGTGPTDEPIDAITVRNNSIHFGAGLTGATGIRLDTVSGGNTGKVTGNLITFASGGSSNKCISYGTLSQYTVADYNLCYGFNTWGTSNGSTYTTLANAQSGGFDTHSVNSDPLYVTTPSTSDTSFQIQSSSPAKNAGTNTYCTRLDAIGYPRTAADATCDIGAREQGNGS